MFARHIYINVSSEIECFAVGLGGKPPKPTANVLIFSLSRNDVKLLFINEIAGTCLDSFFMLD